MVKKSTVLKIAFLIGVIVGFILANFNWAHASGLPSYNEWIHMPNGPQVEWGVSRKLGKWDLVPNQVKIQFRTVGDNTAFLVYTPDSIVTAIYTPKQDITVTVTKDGHTEDIGEYNLRNDGFQSINRPGSGEDTLYDKHDSTNPAIVFVYDGQYLNVYVGSDYAAIGQAPLASIYGAGILNNVIVRRMHYYNSGVEGKITVY